MINLYRNHEARPEAAVLLDVLRQKCEFKEIELPTLASLEPHKADLEAGWATMLEHQLPQLPPVESIWNELPAFFDWLLGGASPRVPAAYVSAPGEQITRESTLRLPLGGIEQSYIEIIRFAASNRLCVDLTYQGSVRRVEPYSLRRTQDENIILHAHNIDKDEHRCYRVDRIQGARVTDQTFAPRFEIELTPRGPVAIAPTTMREMPGYFSRSSRRPRRALASRSYRTSLGPTYVYECSYCGKHFPRKKQNTRLKAHKDKHGYPCPGRTAYLIDTKACRAGRNRL